MKVVDSIKTEKSLSSRSFFISTSGFFKAALIYLMLPLIIFFIGYLKIWWAVLFTGLFGAAAILAMRGFCKKPDGSLLDPKERSIEIKPAFLIFIIVLIPIILYWGGVSEFGCCSADHRVRYAILNDLVEYKWPVVYDFSTQQNPAVAASLGTGSAAFSYYFVFWMVPAVIGKLFGLMAARIALFIWAGIGLGLVAIGASLLYKRASKLLFVLLILFAGFDVIPYIINQLTGTTTTWEGWNLHLYIHGNFFQIMNVFNQSIPGWLITLLLMQSVNYRSIGLLGGLMFCYSPWATIGILPMCICKMVMLHRESFPKALAGGASASASEATSDSASGASDSSVKRFLKNLLTFENILPAAVCLVLFGALYTANPNATGEDGFIWNFYDSALVFLKEYVWYFLFDFGLWFFLIYRKHKKDPMLWTAFITLLILPVYKISKANDFLMRGSMAPVFLIGLYAVMFVTDNFEACRKDTQGVKKAIAGRLVLLIMVVAAYTPGNYILYSALASYQMHHTDEVYEDETKLIGSFGNIIEESELDVVKKQFFVYDYEDSVFFKYFAK